MGDLLVSLLGPESRGCLDGPGSGEIGRDSVRGLQEPGLGEKLAVLEVPAPGKKVRVGLCCWV